MNSYFSILLNREHLLHPFILPSLPFASPKKILNEAFICIKINQAVTAVAVGILSGMVATRINRLAAVGVGISVFYAIAAFFKFQEIDRKCQVAWDKAKLKEPGKELLDQILEDEKLTPENERKKVGEKRIAEEAVRKAEEERLVKEAAEKKKIQEEKEAAKKKKAEEEEEELARKIAARKVEEERLIKEEAARKVEAERLEAERKLSALLDELKALDVSFVSNAKQIGMIFKQLCPHYQDEELIKEYNQHLSVAVPCFVSFSQIINDIFANSALDMKNKTQKIVSLYSSDNSKSYYKNLCHLILLYPRFEEWGGDIRYEELTRDQNLFTQDILINMGSKYSPIIFIQRVAQLQMIIERIANHTKDPNIQNVHRHIAAIGLDINEKRRRIEILTNIKSLLNNARDEGNLEEGQKNAVKLFIENRLYLDPSLVNLNKDIRKWYSSHFPQILTNLFQQIEELKIKIKKTDVDKQKRLKNQLEVLKENLIRYLEYPDLQYGEPIPCLDPWLSLVKEILDSVPLTCAALELHLNTQVKNETVAWMRCLSHLLKLIRENGDEKEIEESKRLFTVMREKIESNLKFKDILVQEKRVKRNEMKILLRELKEAEKA